MPDDEIRVTGPIGPVVASRLPGFSTTAIPLATLLRGTINSPEELRRILDLLNKRGLAPIDVQTKPGRWP